MATSRTPTSAGSAAELRPEELGFLAGGPGRAAEVAVVTLVEAGAVRISREGLVSAVQTRHRAWTPLQHAVLQSLPQALGDVVTHVARSSDASGLRWQLTERGLVRAPGSLSALRTVRRVLVIGAIVAVVLSIAGVVQFGATTPVLLSVVLLGFLLGRVARPLTGAGRAAVQRLKQAATTRNRVEMVAFHGLLGKIEGHLVWEVLGIGPRAAATLKRRQRGKSGGSASSGSGCGSCSSSSCGSASGSDGGSSCGSSSGSSCGGGCGGGGGD
ncbi:TIGR04222 domain-containing membrane protein [Actinosynnema sp. NPDC050436]|uniref:TIGR04222 domain-containing membrane protein n=1 Tax=Actinosynnema sp. NPDC050436 TaxID=3155659 RepID=UPI003403B8D0